MINRNFMIMVVGQIISLFGSAIQRFSMSLYLLEFTGSTATFANILAISTLPYILFAPIAGYLADKVNRKKIMVWLDLICALIIGIYAFILFQGKDHIVIVGMVMFLLSIAATLYGPAVTSALPQIVKEEQLTSANGIVNQVGSIVNFAGPILAGILYSILGIKVIVVMNAISFFISAIMELFLQIPDVNKSQKVPIQQDINFIKDSFREMCENFIYLKKEKKVILGIIASYALCNIFLVPILSIVAPYFINIQLGLSAGVYGLVEGVCVLGMILGGLWISLKPNLFHIEKAHYTYFPMVVGVLLLSTLSRMKLSSYLLAALFGLGGMAIMLSIALSNVLTLTFIQKEVPAKMLGKVSAFSTAVATVSVAPGQLLFGQVMDMGIPMGIILILAAVMNIGLVIFVKWNVGKIE